MEIKYEPKVLVSQVWNAIIISMYREHRLSIDHVQKLLYHQVPAGQDEKRTLRAPAFFISQTDRGVKPEFFPKGSEAERRISFFAQSLTLELPEPLPIDAMPTFTVLTPHYSEKILLSLREIIREEDQNTRVTLLEYLKQLHPIEWSRCSATPSSTRRSTRTPKFSSAPTRTCRSPTSTRRRPARKAASRAGSRPSLTVTRRSCPTESVARRSESSCR